MPTLKGSKIYLRALEPEDLNFLFSIENNESIWSLSNTIQPYSKYVLKQYLANSHQDIFEAKQLRLVICTVQDESIGFIDLFDFDPVNKRAGLGVIIDQENNRGNGFGSEAVSLVIDYVFKTLQIHQVYVGVNEDNKASQQLFTKHNFKHTGTKLDWNRTSEGYCNELTYQLINPQL